MPKTRGKAKRRSEVEDNFENLASSTQHNKQQIQSDSPRVHHPQLESLLRQRKNIETRTIALHKQFNDAIDDGMSKQELAARLGVLEEYFSTFKSVQSQVDCMSETLVDDVEIDDDVYLKYVDAHCVIKGRIQSLIEAYGRKDSSNPALNDSEVRATSVKLPKISLPKFSGKHTEWIDFIQSYGSLVHRNATLSNVDKFLYLKSCLCGTAIQSIDAIDITENNYEIALESLTRRYSNTRLIFKAHVEEMFNIKAVKKNDCASFASVINSFESHYRAISTLGTEAQCLDAVFICFLSKKLDPDTLEKWETSLTTTKLPSFKLFLEFLINRQHALDNISPQFSERSSSAPSKTKSPALMVNSKSTSNKCLFCNSDKHLVFGCDKFRALDFKMRYTEAKRLELCLNCLKPGHFVKDCPTQSRCRICSREHHTLLHNPGATTSTPSASRIQTQPSTSALSCQQTKMCKNLVYGTAIVLVPDRNGKLIPCRALIDCGAGPNFVTEELASKLNISQTLLEDHITGIGSSLVQVRKKMDIEVHSRLSDFKMPIEVAVIKDITGPIPTVAINVSSWKIPSQLPLADPSFHKSSKIDLLIGLEHFLDLLIDGRIQLGPDLPKIQNTVLGWIVMGRSLESTSAKNSVALHCLDVCDLPVEQSTEDLLRRFWELEKVESPNQILSQDDSFAEDFYTHTTRRDSDGRYIVKLPFLKSPSTLGESFPLAYRQFCSLEKRLARKPSLKAEYSKFINEFLELGHMVPIDLSALPEHHYFMPHHAVLKPTSSTTRLRVVFNASARTTTGSSLNDLLAVGPKTQDGLFASLLRFRLPRFAFCADITKMYRQIMVDEDDSYLQLILWRESASEQIKAFRMTRVTYGTASASFLSTRSLRQLALDYAGEFALGSETLLKNLYVDDSLSGDDELDIAQQRQSELIQILAKGGFQIKKWCSNSQSLLSEIPPEDQEPFLQIDENDVIKTLGLIWQPDIDSFRFSYHPLAVNTCHTKRTVLRDVARIYDPLGLINPVIVVLKIFLQRLWSLKLDWDEPLPPAELNLWLEVRESLVLLKDLTIPRIVLNSNGFRSSIQLHGFSDASSKAYGACVYVRTTTFGGETSANLLTSKSSVAPLQTQSIPRLELCGALLLAELMTVCLKYFDLKINSVTLWTDSTIVLSWLRLPPSTLDVFVANRVSKIQSMSQTWTWRHVPTDQNAADYSSRGILPKDLADSELWFKGPAFLKENENSWPQLPNLSDLIIPERKAVHVATVAQPVVDLIQDSMFANSFSRARKVFAYVHRFYSNCIKRRQNGERTTGPLQSAEINKAEVLLVRSIQTVAFSKECEDLRSGKGVHPSSKLATLSPFIDGEGLMRVGGRTHQALITFDERHQILLPKKHPFTSALILHQHLRCYHLGAKALLSVIRQRYWIIDGATVVSRAIRKCVYCIRRAGRTVAPEMGNLPLSRINTENPGTFTVVGVDYAGPFNATLGLRGRAAYKVYMVFFVCFLTKAVHIDIVTDLTSRGFIQTFKIFQATRGKPNILYSDNSSTFLGARRLLTEEQRNAWDTYNVEVQHYMAQEGMEWRTIPPRSPHMGGLWEGGIKQGKRLTKAAINDTVLNVEDLRVVCKEVEAILNSRPIVAMSNDPNDVTALTPAHFLIGRPLLSIPERPIHEESIDHLERHRRIQALRTLIWRRWSTEYLQSLQQKAKWLRTQPNLLVGTLVTLKDDNLPPLQWRLGRVVEVHPGPDGVVRVATVLVWDSYNDKMTSMKRAVRNLCPIDAAQ